MASTPTAGLTSGSTPNTNGDQAFPSVTSLSDGGWVVVWQAYNAEKASFDIYQQRFNGEGTAVDSPAQVNALGKAINYLPSVTPLPDGGWQVIWHAYEGLEDGNYSFGAVSQSFDVMGKAAGPQEPVGFNPTPPNPPLADGGSINVYATANEDGSSFEVYQQRLDADGNAVGDPVQVNTVTSGFQWQTASAGLADGGWVAVWTSQDQDGSDTGIYQQRFDAGGNAVGANILVNTSTLGSQIEPAVTALADGGWVVTWMSVSAETNGWDIYQQRFDASGNASGMETLVNFDPADLVAPSPVADGGAMHDGTDGADSLEGDASDDTMMGNAGNDSLDGGGGDDTLMGGAGSDSIEGGDGDDMVSAGTGDDLIVGGNGAGNDTYMGGAGDDTIRYISATDGIKVDLAKGAASASAGGDAAGIGTDVLSGIENVIAGNFADQLTGDAADNVFMGMAGKDVIDGGAGSDTADYSDKTVSVTVTLNGAKAAVVKVGNVAEDSISNIENVNGGSASDRLTGDQHSNTLDGGKGADVMAGGKGNDTYKVDNAGDTVSEAASSGTDEVHSTVSYALTANVENLVLQGSSGINGTGNTLANRITGNDAANTLNGGAGADTMMGGEGNDTYVVDNVGDVVTEWSGGGTDTVRSSVSVSAALADDAKSAYIGSQVENIQLTGSAATSATGNALDNVITGNSGANTLRGGAGADTLAGGLGRDTYFGGTGDDVFKFNQVADSGLGAARRDVIADFSDGDLIDLSGIDAVAGNASNDAFTLLDAAPTAGSANGVLWFSKGVLYGSTDADTAAEFEIALTGVSSVSADDFVL